MSEEDAEKLFLQEKPALALLFIGLTEKSYASVISKEIDSTFAHTTRILTKMEDCGLIRFTYEGRIKFVELTEYGKRVEAALKEFRDLLREAAPSGETAGKVYGEAEEGNSSKASFFSVREGSDSVGPASREEEGETEGIEDTGAGKAGKNIKELDPVNAELLEKIRAFHSRIENIHREAVERGESRDSISRKLGPFSREIKKLRDRIEEIGEGETSVDERVTDAFGETFKFLESCLRA